jgi:uncharacterized protein YeeX (DUF496 family)
MKEKFIHFEDGLDMIYTYDDKGRIIKIENLRDYFWETWSFEEDEEYIVYRNSDYKTTKIEKIKGVTV